MATQQGIERSINNADREAQGLPQTNFDQKQGNVNSANVSAMSTPEGSDILQGIIDGSNAVNDKNTTINSTNSTNSSVPEVPTEVTEEPKDYSNHIKTVKTMLTKGKTIQELKDELPNIYNSLIDPKSKNPDDVFIHLLAKRNNDYYDKDPVKARAATTSQLQRLGYDIAALDSRSSLVNRVLNGNALTFAQGWAGINNFLGYLNISQFDAIAPAMEQEMSKITSEDSALYESLNPTHSPALYRADGTELRKSFGTSGTVKSTDIATTVGKALPLVGTGFAAGSTKLGIITLDVMPNVAVALGDSDLGTGDIALNIGASLLGYKLANKLSAKTGKTYANIQEYDDAVKRMPDLNIRLQEMAEIEGIDLDKLMTPSTRSSVSVTSRNPDGTYDIYDIDSIPYQPRELYEWYLSSNATVKAAIKKDLTSYIGTQSTNADDFLNNIIANADLLHEVGLEDYYVWAKYMQKIAVKDSNKYNSIIKKLGINGMLTASTGIPGISKILPTVVNDYMSKVANVVAKSIVRETTKPRKVPLL